MPHDRTDVREGVTPLARRAHMRTAALAHANTQIGHARRAATYAERDNCTGVSENIMLGQMCPLGTGAFDLVLNEEALQDAFEVQVRPKGWY